MVSCLRADGELPVGEHQGEDPVQEDHWGCMKVCLREDKHIPPRPDAAGQHSEDGVEKRLEGTGGAFGSTVLLHAREAISTATTKIFEVTSFAVKKNILSVRRRPRQNRVTWKTPSSKAFVPLQEPVAILASYVSHTQMPV